MPRISRVSLIAVTLLAGGIAIAILFMQKGGLGSAQYLDAASANASGGSTVLEDVRVLSSRGGELSWTLTTKSVSMSDSGDKAELQGVLAHMVGQSMDINADRGVYDLGSGSLVLMGNVVSSGQGFSLRTNRAVMEGKSTSGSAVVSADSGVSIEGKGYKLKADNMKLQGDEVRLKNNVRAEIYRK